MRSWRVLDMLADLQYIFALDGGLSCKPQLAPLPSDRTFLARLQPLPTMMQSMDGGRGRMSQTNIESKRGRILDFTSVSNADFRSA